MIKVSLNLVSKLHSDLNIFPLNVTSSISRQLFNHKRFIRKLNVEMGVEPIDLLINLGLRFGKV